MKLAVYATALAALSSASAVVVTLDGNTNCFRGPGESHGAVGGTLAKGGRVSISCRQWGQESPAGPNGASRWWYFTQYGCWINGGWFWGDDLVGNC